MGLSEKYVRSLAKETRNTIDGPYAGRLTGYGKYILKLVPSDAIGFQGHQQGDLETQW